MKADANNNGILTKTELKRYAKNHQGRLNKLLGKGIFNLGQFWDGLMEYDENKDGQIELGEFISWWTYSCEPALIMARQDRKMKRSTLDEEIRRHMVTWAPHLEAQNA